MRCTAVEVFLVYPGAPHAHKYEVLDLMFGKLVRRWVLGDKEDVCACHMVYHLGNPELQSLNLIMCCDLQQSRPMR